MSLSCKIRFEVFKRDGFICQYCGRTPPSIILEIDHINPKSKKGTDDINNLITSCFDCNRGKRNIPLDKIPESLQNNLAILKEKESQLKEYNKILKIIKKREEKEVNEITAIYENYFNGMTFTDNFKDISIKRFLKSLSKQEIIESLNYACQVTQDKDRSIKYFCGICWNKIKAKTDPNYHIEKELKSYWNKQPRGSGYLDAKKIKYWIDKYKYDEIIKAMDQARGMWAELKRLLP